MKQKIIIRKCRKKKKIEKKRSQLGFTMKINSYNKANS